MSETAKNRTALIRTIIQKTEIRSDEENDPEKIELVIKNAKLTANIGLGNIYRILSWGHVYSWR